MRQTSVSVLTKSKKRSLLASLDELAERMPSLLEVDHPCAQNHIAQARYDVEVCSLLTTYLISNITNPLWHIL